MRNLLIAGLGLFFAAISVVAQAADARLYYATVDTVAPSGTEAPGLGLSWDVLYNSAKVADNTDVQGWAVSYSSLTNRFTITPPWNKPVGSEYKLRYTTGGINRSLDFDLCAKIPAALQTSFQTNDITPPPVGQTWQVTKGGVQVASSTSTASWSVGHYSNGNPWVLAPLGSYGDDYEVFVNTTLGPRSGKFSLVAPRIDTSWTKRPAWADAARPLDAVGAPGDGPSGSVTVDGSSGVLGYLPPADLKVYNRLGPSVSFTRGFQSGLAYTGTAGLGMARGWYEGYDFRFVAVAGSWGNVTFIHPNGAEETFAPILDGGGNPTGTFSASSGRPYALRGDPGISPGVWDSLTIHYKDLSQWRFESFGTAGMYRLARITDLNGRYIVFSRGSAERIELIENSVGDDLLDYVYNGDGMLAEAIDKVANVKIVLTYDTRYGYKVPLKVSEVGDVSAGTFPDRYSYEYAGVASTPHLATIRMRDPSNPSFFVAMSATYEYYNGRIRYLTDAGGFRRIYTYDSNTTNIRVNKANGTEQQSWRQRFSLGLSTGYIDAFNNTFAIAASSTAPTLPGTVTNRNGDSISITYDDFGNIETITNLRGVTTTYTYDYLISPTGLCTQIETDGLIPTQYTYHPSGHLHQIKTPVPGMTSGAPQVSEEFEYNGNGSIAAHKVLRSWWNPTSSIHTDELVSYTFSYDPSGDWPYLPVTITDPLGESINAAYNARGQVIGTTDEVGAFTEYIYNSSGQLIEIREPTVTALSPYNGIYKTKLVYDYTGGRLIRVEKYDGSNTLKYTENIGRDNEGGYKSTSGDTISSQVNLDGVWKVASHVNGNSNTTSFGYDAAGNVTSMSYPTGAGVSVTYDAEGNVTSQTNGRSQTTTYTLAPDDGRVTGWTNSDETVSLVHDDYGRVIEVSDSSGTRSCTYDDLGNILEVETEFTGLVGTYSITYDYNLDGSRHLMTTPAGAHLYRYDKNGQAIGVSTSSVSGGPTWTAADATYLYHENGLLRRSVRSKFQTNYVYNGRRQLQSATTIDPSSFTSRHTYSQLCYDVLGNLARVTISFPQIGAGESLNGALFLSRDSKNQLIREERTWTGQSPITHLYDNEFSRDNNGNVTVMDDRSVTLFAETYNANDQRQSSGNTHDNDGNMTQVDSRTVVYDSQSRVIEADGIRNKWSVEGTRAWKDYGTTYQSRQYYLYDGDVVVCEIGGANTTVAVGAVYAGYAYGPDGLIARARVGGPTVMHGFDPFGSPTLRHATNAGSPTHFMAYDMQGRNHVHHLTSTGASAPLDQDPIGAFAQFGQFTDEQTAFQSDAAGARLKSMFMSSGGLYDPKAGRFAGRYGAIGNRYAPGEVRFAQAMLQIGTNLSDFDTWSRPIHDGLEAAGMIPVLGMVPDLINTAIHSAEGNYVEAGVSAGAALPFFGDAFGGVRIAQKAAAAQAATGKIVGVVTSSMKKYAGRFGSVYTLLDENGKIVYVGRTFFPKIRRYTHSINPKFKGLRFNEEIGNLNYAEQRGAEQILMNKYKPIYNVRRGIGINNKNHDFYIQEGWTAIRREGYSFR